MSFCYEEKNNVAPIDIQFLCPQALESFAENTVKILVNPFVSGVH